MDHAVTAVLASLEGRNVEFREQVEKMREFRERMRKQGADVKDEPYTVPLMERLGRVDVVRFKLTDMA